MAIEADIRAFLLTLDEVTAIVGERIYPDVVPQLTKEQREEYQAEGIIMRPYIVIDMVEERPQNTLEGRDGLVMAVVDIRCLATTKKVARELSEAVRINGENPGTGLAGYSGDEFEATLTANFFDAHQITEGGDDWAFEVTARYDVSYQQTS